MQFVKAVDTDQFGVDVLERSKQVPVVVDFWAEWCGPCRVLGPALERVTAEHGGRFELAKVDVDRNQALARQFGVQGIPTVIGFRDGKPVSRFTGAIPEPVLRQWVDQLLPSEVDEAVAHANDQLRAGDRAAAEATFRQALATQPDHTDAVVGLAGLLIGDERSEEAEELLARIPSTPDVERLRAAARLGVAARADLDGLRRRVADDPSDLPARLELGKALVATGAHEEGLEELLAVVAADGELQEPARVAIVDLFEVLGADHPVTVAYRRRLASALF